MAAKRKTLRIGRSVLWAGSATSAATIMMADLPLGVAITMLAALFIGLALIGTDFWFPPESPVNPPAPTPVAPSESN